MRTAINYTAKLHFIKKKQADTLILKKLTKNKNIAIRDRNKHYEKDTVRVEITCKTIEKREGSKKRVKRER